MDMYVECTYMFDKPAATVRYTNIEQSGDSAESITTVATSVSNVSKCKRTRRSFQSDLKFEGLPKVLDRVRVFVCVAAYVINSAGKHAYSQTAAGGG